MRHWSGALPAMTKGHSPRLPELPTSVGSLRCRWHGPFPRLFPPDTPFPYGITLPQMRPLPAASTSERTSGCLIWPTTWAQVPVAWTLACRCRLTPSPSDESGMIRAPSDPHLSQAKRTKRKSTPTQSLGNPSVLQARRNQLPRRTMHPTVDAHFLKAASSNHPRPPANSRTRAAIGRGRRKDDATFIAIGGLLALYFLVQFGWVILHTHP
jgi:hypothetical protein